MPLKTGKLDPSTLRRLVLDQLGVQRDDVVVHARLGEDASAVAFGDEVCVLSSDPITGAGSNAGWYAVHVSCNDIAAMGARPVGVLATLIFPTSTEEADVGRVMADITARPSSSASRYWAATPRLRPGSPLRSSR